MNFLTHCAFLGLIALATASLVRVQPDCSTHECPANKTCVMQEVQCFYPPCGRVPTCEDTVRPGSCPTPSNNGLIGICIARCSSDATCPTGMKCCGNCPRDCVRPVEVTVPKPGRCPPRPFFNSWCPSVQYSCDTDDDCTGTDKCCRNGCGRSCQRAFLDDEQLPY